MNSFDIRIKLNPSLWNSSVQRMPKGKGSGWRMRKQQQKKRTQEQCYWSSCQTLPQDSSTQHRIYMYTYMY